MTFTLTDRLLSLFDYLGLKSAHLATQLPDELSGFISVHPQRITGLLSLEAVGLNPAHLQQVADRLTIVAGDGGMSAKVATAAMPLLTGAKRITLPDYSAPFWADCVTDHRDIVISALLAMRNDGPTPTMREPSGAHAGISYKVHGNGPALLLFPLLLSSAQWTAALPELRQHFTVYELGGPHFGGVALLEERALSSSYAAMMRSVVDVMAPEIGDALLEVGPGSGATTRIVAHHKRDLRITAVDINEYLLGEARALVQRDGLDDRVSFAPGNAEALPFEPASFDHAYSVTVLEECDADLALKELHRIVKPGGRVGVIVRALDMPYPWNVDAPDDIKRKIELPPPLVGTKGVADKSIYTRMAAGGFEDLTCFPMLASFKMGNSFWSYMESRALSRLTTEELVIFRDAVARATEAGVLFCSVPHHCVVGRKPTK